MSWRELRAAATARLAAAGVASPAVEARFLTEAVSGFGPDEWVEIADAEPTARARARVEAMLDRRVAGEPLQYVIGAWGFRDLDLMVDRRVLIPRPETEIVVEVALAEAVRLGLRRARPRPDVIEAPPRAVVADLGTGSGAIAIALAAELPDVEVWAADASIDALAVAAANVAGCAATRVRLAPPGSWFTALPTGLRGRLALVVANPPYIAEAEVAELPAEVADHEPYGALVAGPLGTEALDHLLAEGRRWVATPGALVLELAPHQAATMADRARALGWAEVVVHEDLTGRARVLVARAG
ncbi:MAG: peptide chain release factor N(5)-glutamine methyltransferase [Actinomycetota bacterium]